MPPFFNNLELFDKKYIKLIVQNLFEPGKFSKQQDIVLKWV